MPGLGSCADSVAKLLVDAKFTSVFTESCSALECACPIVVAAGGFARDVRAEGWERGAVTVAVRVVREVSADAESVAHACERALRRARWEECADAGQYRIVGLVTEAPALELRDGSGRFVWKLDVVLTVAREI